MPNLWLLLFGHLFPALPPAPPDADGPDEYQRALMAEAQAARDRAEGIVRTMQEPKPQNPSTRPA